MSKAENQLKFQQHSTQYSMCAQPSSCFVTWRQTSLIISVYSPGARFSKLH